MSESTSDRAERFTAGPWRFTDAHGTPYFREQYQIAGTITGGLGGQRVIADFQAGPVGEPPASMKADAHLIAAAPELYRAIQVLLGATKDEHAHRVGTEALAAARGER